MPVSVIIISGHVKDSMKELANEIVRLAVQTRTRMYRPDLRTVRKVPIPLGKDRWKVNYLDIHSLTFHVAASDKFLRAMMRLRIPDNLNIELMLKG